nr:aldose 1-epimerase family protein [Ferrithrix thermotolerans]
MAASGYSCTVTQVGATLRSLSFHGRDLIESFSEREICPAAHGAFLFPWPNRIEKGSYLYEGNSYQLDISEPSTMSAIHGLCRWQPFVLTEWESDFISLSYELYPTPGYPFHLGVSLSYKLRDDGLVVTTQVENLGERRALYGVGHHPYLSPGASYCADDVILTIDAQTVCNRQVVDPLGRVVPPSAFAEGVSLRGLILDDTFSDLKRDKSTVSRVSITGGDKVTVEIWMDEHYRYVQIFSGDTLDSARRRKAVAIEPMTCPPQAFRTKEAVFEIAPQEMMDMRWGMRIK